MANRKSHRAGLLVALLPAVSACFASSVGELCSAQRARCHDLASPVVLLMAPSAQDFDVVWIDQEIGIHGGPRVPDVVSDQVVSRTASGAPAICFQAGYYAWPTKAVVPLHPRGGSAGSSPSPAGTLTRAVLPVPNTNLARSSCELRRAFGAYTSLSQCFRLRVARVRAESRARSAFIREVAMGAHQGHGVTVTAGWQKV